MPEPAPTWFFPAEFPLPEARVLPGGPSLHVAELSVHDLQDLLASLRKGVREDLRHRPAREIAGALGQVGRRFLDPADPIRAEALASLPDSAGVSSGMAAEILDGMALDWTPERLRTLLAMEFEDASVLDRFQPGRSGRSVRALGPELTVHFGAGNVPGVSVTSMIRALLVKSGVFLRPSRSDLVLPRLFAEALEEMDPGLARSVAVAYWPTDREALTETVIRSGDLVVAYGGDGAVSRLRGLCPAQTRFLAYRHRLSCGILGRESLRDRETARRSADEAARAVSIFDQRGCVSPHLFFVERGGAVSPSEWGSLLARCMDAWARRIPPGEMETAEAAAIQQLRGSVEIRIAAGEGLEIWQGENLTWTVILDPEVRFRASSLGRVARVVPVDRPEQAVAAMDPVRSRLQTVVVDGLGERVREVANQLAELGASRVTTFREGPWPPPWWHHDGEGPLRALVRWTDLEV